MLKYHRNNRSEFIFLFLPFMHSGAIPLGMFLIIFLYFSYLVEGSKKSIKKVDNSTIKKIRYLSRNDSRAIFLFRISLFYLIISTGIFFYYSSGDDYSKNVLDLSYILSLSYVKLLIVIGGKTVFDSLLVTFPFVIFIYFNRKIVSTKINSFR